MVHAALRPTECTHLGLASEGQNRWMDPVVSPFREITNAGGLLSYGPDRPMLFRRSASLIEQILKGARAGGPPIGLPTEPELVANRSAAQALNLGARFGRRRDSHTSSASLPSVSTSDTAPPRSPRAAS